MEANFTLWGMGGAVLTALIMKLIKVIWPQIKDRAAVLCAIGVGLVLGALAYLGSQFLGVQVALDVIGSGLLAGLAACGLYSGVKKRP